MRQWSGEALKSCFIMLSQSNSRSNRIKLTSFKKYSSWSSKDRSGCRKGYTKLIKCSMIEGFKSLEEALRNSNEIIKRYTSLLLRESTITCWILSQYLSSCSVISISYASRKHESLGSWPINKSMKCLKKMRRLKS